MNTIDKIYLDTENYIIVDEEGILCYACAEQTEEWQIKRITTDEALAYIHWRGIDDSILGKLNGFNKEKQKQYDLMQNKLKETK